VVSALNYLASAQLLGLSSASLHGLFGASHALLEEAMAAPLSAHLSSSRRSPRFAAGPSE